jgi:predicted NUDIX family NTP pyrophosphohydrolase
MSVSCGLLMYLKAPLRVLLVHPGGPYWRDKDKGVWSIPKGLPDPGEDEFAAARREFNEETGITPLGPFLDLGALKQKSGKLVRCWAFKGDDAAEISPGRSQFEMEWPPRSGERAFFPEVDDARLFEFEDALQMILPGQAPFVRDLAARVL